MRVAPIWYWLLAYCSLFSSIGISCIVADTANYEFHILIFSLLLCICHFPLNLLWYENVQEKIAL